MTTSPLLLPAASPDAWLATHLEAHYDAHGETPQDATGGHGRWLTSADLLDDSAAPLREQHRRLVETDRTPPAAAATCLAGWTAGSLADAVGFALATSAAGFLADAAHTRWHQHPDGWMDRVDLGRCRVVAADGHPWSGLDLVETVPDDEAVRQRCVAALVEMATPLVDACHGLARVGRAGLWNEVVDSLGMAVCFKPTLPTRAQAVEALAAAVRSPGTPWRARPDLRIIEHPVIGPVYVAQKGGCCLAYTRQRDGGSAELDPEAAPDADADADPEAAPDADADADPEAGPDPDEEHCAYLARFPDIAGQPRYCSTCMFRDAPDVEARQLFWLEREHRRQSHGHTGPSASSAAAPAQPEDPR